MLRFQAVAEAVYGQEMPRFAGGVLYFLAQFDDELIKGPGSAVVFDAPDFPEDGIAGNGVAAFTKEQGEDFEFAGREFESFASTLAPQCLAIDPHFAERDFLGQVRGLGAGLGATQEGMHAGEEFTQAEGLGHIVIGPEFEAHHFVDLLSLRGEHEDWYAVFTRADFTAKIVAALARQHDIENEQIGFALTEQGSGLQAVSAFADFITLAAQRIAQAETDMGVIFDDEEMLFHGCGYEFRLSRSAILIGDRYAMQSG